MNPQSALLGMRDDKSPMFMRGAESQLLDSKSGGRKAVWVQFPPRAPIFTRSGHGSQNDLLHARSPLAPPA
jgi:hypothetical protein